MFVKSLEIKERAKGKYYEILLIIRNIWKIRKSNHLLINFMYLVVNLCGFCQMGRLRGTTTLPCFVKTTPKIDTVMTTFERF